MQTLPKIGLDALLTPENCVLVLIDHQPFQLANVNSHDPAIVINNVTGLAKTAKVYRVPTILTTVNEERGGLIFKQVQAVFPDQKTINRTFINCWEDHRVVEAVKKTGRKKLGLAGLWTEMCGAMPAIHAVGEGPEDTWESGPPRVQEDVVVSATRSEGTVADVPVSVPILTKEQIAATRVHTTDDLLRAIRGLNLPATSSNVLFPTSDTVSM